MHTHTLVVTSMRLEDVKAAHVRFTLERLNWNVKAAARELDIDRRQLYRLCERYDIKRPPAPPGAVLKGDKYPVELTTVRYYEPGKGSVVRTCNNCKGSGRVYEGG